MSGRHVQKSGINIIFLVALLLVAAVCAVYFYIDQTAVSMEIAVIDSTEYAGSVYEKGDQHKAIGVPLAAEAIEELSGGVYKTPLGFSIVSYSKKWKGEKLIEIYNELLNNVHGDEITYVGEVDVFPAGSEYDTKNTLILGTQSSKQEYYPVFFDLPSMVSNNLRYLVKPNVSVIELYNMDKFDSAAQAAKTIAHEYGHHFTKYYFLKDTQNPIESEYYNLRNLKDAGHDVIFDNWETYIKNHEWDIYELAAEDYVQLMGSPNAKQTQEYLDRYDLLRTGEEDYNPVINNNVYNAFPQENIHIPMADEIPGLKDYYYSFIGKKEGYTSLEPADFNLKITKRSRNGYTYYDITWTKTSIDKDALYTLVCYNTAGEPVWPVKTVRGDKEPIAKVGTPSIIKGRYIHYWPDRIPDEDRIFKLYLLLPDGRIQASKPFHVNF